MVAGVAGLLTFIKERMGEDAVADAHAESMERDWRRQVERIARTDRKALVHLLAATWRAHSTGGVGRNPGAFTITEDAEKVTFAMNPCGSGQRLLAQRPLRAPRRVRADRRLPEPMRDAFAAAYVHGHGLWVNGGAGLNVHGIRRGCGTGC
jgi:hypothetical protein